MLLQLLISLVTWSVMNITVDINAFRLIYLDTSQVSQEKMCLPGFDVVKILESRLM